MDYSSSEEREEIHINLAKMEKKGSKWFVQDPCGIACAVATYIFLVYGEIVVFVVVLPPFPSISMFLIVFLFSSLVFLSIASHVKAMCTNPVSGPAHILLTPVINV